MAQKKVEVVETAINLEQIKPKTLIVTVNGTSDLILCKKSRSYELAEIYKQSHPKGSKIPQKYQQDYCLWEKLITSIHWQQPITFHDDDNTLYTEEEWSHVSLLTHGLVHSTRRSSPAVSRIRPEKPERI